jgi:hypothetical protein
MEDVTLTTARDAWADISPGFPGVEARFSLDGPTRIVVRFRDRDGNEAGCVIRRAEIGTSRHPQRAAERDLREALALLGKAGERAGDVENANLQAVRDVWAALQHEFRGVTATISASDTDVRLELRHGSRVVRTVIPGGCFVTTRGARAEAEHELRHGLHLLARLDARKPG